MQNNNMNISNPVIIESLFRETSRNGKHTIRLVLLALTSKLLSIASSHSFGSSVSKSPKHQNILEIRSLHPLDSMKLIIFKKSKRWTLKLCFHNRYERYFELDKARGSNEVWRKWCKNILLMKQDVKRKSSLKSLNKTTSYDRGVFNVKWESQKCAWNDKYLYLGDKRETEDNSRPIPIQGLGPPEDIKLLHLKPKYFGCWGQTEHWVQCEESNKLPP